MELEFGNVGFGGGRKTREPGKPLGARTRTNKKLTPLTTLGTRIVPRPHVCGVDEINELVSSKIPYVVILMTTVM